MKYLSIYLYIYIYIYINNKHINTVVFTQVAFVLYCVSFEDLKLFSKHCKQIKKKTAIHDQDLILSPLSTTGYHLTSF